ncbi:glycosyltransferase [uncultured Gelidibacter sp.]|uniref:glycosyltransferase n=1 Tax=uncultured Gelidibacter sp. TaxID=259318 RepID=UPI00263096ED|nr:glycosyltransferase [uncultured Gelidibacter sp.]
MRVTIGIPTFNREDLLKIMAKSLYNSDLSAETSIRVYDDCSTEYDKEYLNSIFPTAASINVNSNNLRADKNMYFMYADFLKNGDDYFFNADADLIFNKHWLKKGLELIQKTDGVLSLFNTNAHKSYQLIDNQLCLKETIGAAGTLFTREQVLNIMVYFDSIEKVQRFDWQWCNYLKVIGVKINCVNQSLVQHIGYKGQNSRLYFDVGKNYQIESLEEGQVVHDIFVNSIDAIRIKESERAIKLSQLNAERANDFWYHFKRCIIIVLKVITPSSLYNKLKS